MMSRDLVSLQSIIGQASRSLAPVTGESARYQHRASSGGKAHVILCDVSSSMSESAGGALRRIDHLNLALDQLRRPDIDVAAFSTGAAWVPVGARLPSPSGGTALEMGLDLIASRNPAHTLVISDGEPNQPAAALDAAKRLPGVINVLFCGDERNLVAVEFMRALARLGCGQYAAHSWRANGVPLVQSMRLLLR